LVNVYGFGKGCKTAMLKINRRIDYAIRVMLCLARRMPGSRLPTQVVQEEMQIPRPILRRIIANLAHVGLVNTFAGPNGGLELAHPARAIHLRHIWEAVEGPVLISDCLEEPNSCPLEAECSVNREWCRLQNLIVRELESINIEQLAHNPSHRSEELCFQTVTSGLYAPFGSK
jgi:Rrf2 family iron-sulfur cluster assembly transcriptional regulator